jgi:tyrosine-protein kinase Etk/Wzc
MNLQNHTIQETVALADEIPSSDALGKIHEVGLIDVLTQLAYRKWLVLKVTGIGMLIGLIVCFELPPRYQATAKLMPPQQTQSTSSLLMSQLAGAGGASLTAMASGGLGLKNPNDIYIGLLTSRPVADAIIQKFGLLGVYKARDMTEARKALAASTQVAPEKSGFIDISVTDPDKERASELANAYADQLHILTKTLAVTEASQRRLFYDQQLKQSKEALVAASLSFQQVQQHKGLIQLNDQAKAMIESLSQLRAKVSVKQVEVQALRSYSTERNPDLQLAERELESMQAEASHLERSNHEPGIAGLGLENVPSAGMEYLRGEHEVQYQQALYDMLMKQYDAARLDESKDAAIIQIVEPAIKPDIKSSPKRALILLVFTLSSLFAGCLLALFLSRRELLHLDPEMEIRLGTLKNAVFGNGINAARGTNSQVTPTVK